MGGYYYFTKDGDMWDYVAWIVYGDENLVGTLMRAEENRRHLETYIFSKGEQIWCPYIDETVDEMESPDWRDSE